MIGSFVALLLFQLVGELIVRSTGLPLPGPVLGMLLLFAALLLYGDVPVAFGKVTRGLLAYLALLFVPAGVGIISHLNLVESQWFALVITLVASTAITLVVTAFTLHLLMRRRHT